jgi:hypothetical protein
MPSVCFTGILYQGSSGLSLPESRGITASCCNYVADLTRVIHRGRPAASAIHSSRSREPPHRADSASIKAAASSASSTAAVKFAHSKRYGPRCPSDPPTMENQNAVTGTSSLLKGKCSTQLTAPTPPCAAAPGRVPPSRADPAVEVLPSTRAPTRRRAGDQCL